MKTHIIFMLVLQILGAGAALGSQDSLGQRRTARLNQAVAALVSADADSLRAVMTGERQAISKEEALSILKKVTDAWGELRKLEEVNEADLKTTFDKGDMQILVHWGTTPTQYGVWKLFRSDKRKDSYLRIGLLFAKGSDQVGQFIVAEFPIPQHQIPNGPGTTGGK